MAAAGGPAASVGTGGAAMMGIEEPIEIPNSCQNHLNGDLPEEVKMQYSSKDGEGLLTRILADHGLIFYG